eukprot:112350-Chlamydomonas_euryale.AAC.4
MALMPWVDSRDPDVVALMLPLCRAVTPTVTCQMPDVWGAVAALSSARRPSFLLLPFLRRGGGGGGARLATGRGWAFRNRSPAAGGLSTACVLRRAAPVAAARPPLPATLSARAPSAPRHRLDRQSSLCAHARVALLPFLPVLSRPFAPSVTQSPLLPALLRAPQPAPPIAPSRP